MEFATSVTREETPQLHQTKTRQTLTCFRESDYNAANRKEIERANHQGQILKKKGNISLKYKSDKKAITNKNRTIKLLN